MPRFVLLQTVDVEFAAPAVEPAAAPAAKLDPAVEFVGVTGEGFTFQVPAYDPATHNTLVALHVSLFPKPADGTAPAIPGDPAEIVKAELHYSADTSTVTTEHTVVIDASAAPVGKYSAALVAEFDQ